MATNPASAVMAGNEGYGNQTPDEKMANIDVSGFRRKGLPLHKDNLSALR